MTHEKDTSFWRLGVWYLWVRGHEEEVRQTIRGERISSSRMLLSRVDSTDIPNGYKPSRHKQVSPSVKGERKS